MTESGTFRAVGIFRLIVSVLAGLAVLGVGLGLLINELWKPSFHAVHVSLAAGLMAFGGYLIEPKEMKELILIALPFIPRIGGRRAEDQQVTAIVTAPQSTVEPGNKP